MLTQIDPSATESITSLIEQATAADGQPPFSDQTLVDARSGSRRTFLLEADDGTGVGAAITSEDPAEFEFLIAPDHRRSGHGRRALTALLARYRTDVLVWAHGDHPAAARLAADAGLVRVRTLYQLRMPLIETAPQPIPDVQLSSFDAHTDADEWIALNARIFSDHPEQGQIDRDDLDARMAEPWFDAGDFIIARDESGTMIAYLWLKIVDGEDAGEIYVLGVDPDRAGSGLGRRLMEHGLHRLRERGCDTAALYVDDGNARALHLYRSMGFTEHTIDVQYLHRS